MKIPNIHCRACLFAGIPITDTQAGDMPGLWSFEISSSDGLKIADQLWMARYLLHYIGEEFGTVVSFEDKPLADIDLTQNLKVLFNKNKLRQTGEQVFN